MLINSLSIHCIAQDSTAKTCIENYKLKFFMEEHLRAKSLRVDTTIMGETIKDLDGIIEFKDGQIADKQVIVETQKNHIQEQKKAFNSLSDQYKKEVRRNKRLKITSWVLTGIGATLGIISLVK